jgi:hypothetical protein
MALAIRQRQPIRGATAIARRTDGTWASFIPCPTHVFDAVGGFIGAVNLLVDITGSPERERWLREARRCRRLAGASGDPRKRSRPWAEYEEKGPGHAFSSRLNGSAARWLWLRRSAILRQGLDVRQEVRGLAIALASTDGIVKLGKIDGIGHRITGYRRGLAIGAAEAKVWAASLSMSASMTRRASPSVAS